MSQQNLKRRHDEDDEQSARKRKECGDYEQVSEMSVKGKGAVQKKHIR
jgi:hypothetical protein